mmetsp:Transcript_13869/g.20990  ORF Transcript_13869/g.20990 Transcript_13869/m.20990 type:complete len:208 (+) Transcript_13869:1531-2154(+)
MNEEIWLFLEGNAVLFGWIRQTNLCPHHNRWHHHKPTPPPRVLQKENVVWSNFNKENPSVDFPCLMRKLLLHHRYPLDPWLLNLHHLDNNNLVNNHLTNNNNKWSWIIKISNKIDHNKKKNKWTNMSSWNINKISIKIDHNSNNNLCNNRQQKKTMSMFYNDKHRLNKHYVTIVVKRIATMLLQLWSLLMNTPITCHLIQQRRMLTI